MNEDDENGETRIEFATRVEVLSGKELPKPKPVRKDLELNLMYTEQDGPMWLRQEGK